MTGEFLAERGVVEPTLVVVGLNHRTAPVDVRERFWMSAERRGEALSALSHSEGIEEAFVFSTCHRTEFVVWGDPTLAPNSVLRFLAAQYDLKLCEWGNFYRLLDERALVHAFCVSCELDSIYVGEGQIARQVNAAWQQARKAGSTGRYLDAVLRKALAVRRRVRKATAICAGFISAPYAALDLAREVLGPLATQKVVLIGAGKMGELLAQALVNRGARSIAVVSRSKERAIALAARMGIRALRPEELFAQMAEANLVISATSTPEFVLRVDEMKQVASRRCGRKLVLIDLALPRDVDPAVRVIPGMCLYDLDDLEQAVQPRAASREGEVEAQKIVLEEVQRFRKEIGTSPAITALRQRLDEICRQELDSFRREQGPFPKDQDHLIAALGARITHRIAGSLARDLKNPLEPRGQKRPTAHL